MCLSCFLFSHLFIILTLPLDGSKSKQTNCWFEVDFYLIIITEQNREYNRLSNFTCFIFFQCIEAEDAWNLCPSHNTLSKIPAAFSFLSLWPSLLWVDSSLLTEVRVWQSSAQKETFLFRFSLVKSLRSRSFSQNPLCLIIPLSNQRQSPRWIISSSLTSVLTASVCPGRLMKTCLTDLWSK